ncbi:hypothetical protein [Natronomonas amylolytica]|uniref:hypothetical protein n=1 Tax=Natronomonas amylolytica TaxID=3108498 RepID=UPI00300BCD4B
METRTAGVLIGALALCCLTLVVAAVYPVSTSSSHANVPASERFEVGDDADAYRTSGRIVVEGNVSLAFEATVTADGARYQRLEEEGVTSEQYQASPSDPVYERLRIEDESDAERLRARITDDEARRLLHTERTDDNVTLVVAENGTDLAAEISGSASVFVRSLYVVGYERVDADATDTTVYGPQSGWYEGTEPYRVTDATGTVSTGADTPTVESASVSWKVTDPAGSYAEYLLVRLTGPDPRHYELAYEFEGGAVDLDRPAWVEDARDES